MEINVVDLEPLRVAALSHKGAFSQIGGVFNRLHGLLQEDHLESAPLVAIYLDDPHQVSEDLLRSFAGAILRKDAELPAGTESVTIPGGRYAMASFVGDYSNLPKAWEDFYVKGVGPSGLKTKADLCFERYINTPMDTKPENLITELYAPIE
jgi:AraC family transcriptional regulator